jgi:hypothetical protein
MDPYNTPSATNPASPFRLQVQAMHPYDTFMSASKSTLQNFTDDTIMQVLVM